MGYRMKTSATQRCLFSLSKSRRRERVQSQGEVQAETVNSARRRGIKCYDRIQVSNTESQLQSCPEMLWRIPFSQEETEYQAQSFPVVPPFLNHMKHSSNQPMNLGSYRYTNTLHFKWQRQILVHLLECPHNMDKCQRDGAGCWMV